MNLHASFHGERCWTCVFQFCSGFSDYGWWFQTWLDDFPFHIWDVIRKPLTFTHSMIFQDGFYSHHQVFFGSPKKFSRDRQVTWRSLGPWLLTSDFSNIYSSGPTNSYKWDEITPATQVIYQMSLRRQLDSQRIGLVGKILTGSHVFSHEIWGVPVTFSIKPIHWYIWGL